MRKRSHADTGRRVFQAEETSAKSLMGKEDGMEKIIGKAVGYEDRKVIMNGLVARSSHLVFNLSKKSSEVISWRKERYNLLCSNSIHLTAMLRINCSKPRSEAGRPLWILSPPCKCEIIVSNGTWDDTKQWNFEYALK